MYWFQVSWGNTIHYVVQTMIKPFKIQACGKTLSAFFETETFLFAQDAKIGIAIGPKIFPTQKKAVIRVWGCPYKYMFYLV